MACSVDRKRAASYGLNLSAYQLGFTFSPEAAPSSTGGAGALLNNQAGQPRLALTDRAPQLPGMIDAARAAHRLVTTEHHQRNVRRHRHGLPDSRTKALVVVASSRSFKKHWHSRARRVFRRAGQGGPMNARLLEGTAAGQIGRAHV